MVPPGPETSLILASASPRRRDLLTEAGISFRIEPAGVDEDIDESDPERCARALAELKAGAVAELHAEEPAWVLGADTVVAVGEGAEAVLLGKPADEAEAHAMLSRLSATRHRVVTGVCAIRCADGHRVSEVERTFVTMRPIRPEEVEAYVASGEWRDKAGGYAIQETADAFVISLEGGGFDNVVGLPVALTRRLLGEAGWPG